VARSIRADLVPGDPLTTFYAARRYAPLWVKNGKVDPAALALLAAVREARADNLDPADYHGPEAAGAIDGVGRGPAEAATAEIALSRTFAGYIGDLHRPAPGTGPKFTDPGVAVPPTDPAAILRRAAAAPSLTWALRQGERMNPLYTRLKAALAKRGAARRGGLISALIALNLERARALPPDPGARFILVNAPSQALWFYDHGHERGGMRVVVGANDNRTPPMIGLIRFALLSPFWNVPPDLVRKDIAPAVLREGEGYLARRHFQTVGAAPVDWEAVADGSQQVMVRQAPGPDNVMGKVKFMLPNPLGIYLHDTPQKGLFAEARRADSHGCIRLQAAGRLAAWLFGGAVKPSGAPDQEIDLAAPVPVYIVYLTVMPTRRGLAFAPDIYHRDRPLRAALARRR
jgi:murein L,D-transpeptidase YcbB/YkuD